MTAPRRRNGNGTIEDVLPGEAAVARAARRSLEGRSRGLPRIWPFLGPAFIAAVAYIDPGNFATNIAGGAQFGYLLLWVVLAANLIAMVVQTQSAKLGIATGKNLPEACRALFSRRTSIGPLGPGRDRRDVDRHRRGGRRGPCPQLLLFGCPCSPPGWSLGRRLRDPRSQQRGFRRLEAVIAGMVGVVVLGFAFEIVNSEPDGGEALKHLVVPGFAAPRASSWPPGSSAPR